MKRTVVFAGLLAASAFAFPALAEETTTQSGTTMQSDTMTQSETTTGTSTEVDPGATASTDAKANFGTVMSSIRAGKTNIDAISALTTVNTVNVVRVSDLAKGENMQALDKAISENQADVTSLQTAIEGNAALKAKLDEESVNSADVVAANVEADGSVTVYVK